MPRSRRSKVVSLTQTQKKTMEHKKKMVEDVRSCLDEYDNVWLFSVRDMRTDGLQEVRNLWKGTGRIIYGKNKVVAKALGETPETEYKSGLSQIAKRLKGPVGLFLTSYSDEEVVDWFGDYSRPAFARQHSRATESLTLPAGPILDKEDETFQHSMEPQLRSCGLMTYLEKGIPSLKVETEVCKEGEKLSAEKARLLMLLGHMQAKFKIELGSHWSEEKGFTQGADLSADGDDVGSEKGEDVDMA